MWKYEKKLEYPVNINRKDLNIAKCLFAQYGGPDSELSAALKYLNQRYTMPDERGFALLTDIGTEELAHWEILATMIFQLLKGATIDEIKQYGLSEYYTMHNHSPFPSGPLGSPWSSDFVQATGDYKADLETNMASEQRARVTYENVMNLTNDPDVLAPLAFLRQREIVHYQRFKELLEYYNQKYN